MALTSPRARSSPAVIPQHPGLLRWLQRGWERVPDFQWRPPPLFPFLSSSEKARGGGCPRSGCQLRWSLGLDPAARASCSSEDLALALPVEPSWHKRPFYFGPAAIGANSPSC